MCELIHRMLRVEQNMEMLERGSSVKRPQVGEQRMLAGHYGKNNDSKHKYKSPEATDLSVTKEMAKKPSVGRSH